VQNQNLDEVSYSEPEIDAPGSGEDLKDKQEVNFENESPEINNAFGKQQRPAVIMEVKHPESFLTSSEGIMESVNDEPENGTKIKTKYISVSDD